MRDDARECGMDAGVMEEQGGAGRSRPWRAAIGGGDSRSARLRNGGAPDSRCAGEVQQAVVFNQRTRAVRLESWAERGATRVVCGQGGGWFDGGKTGGKTDGEGRRCGGERASQWGRPRRACRVVLSITKKNGEKKCRSQSRSGRAEVMGGWVAKKRGPGAQC
ncbi:hypothetical protein BS50DRAFT_227775 [Corynespora cassiicola Philippines]|uniref:Uncharacterized protein n=1 Tax=Corynespora cassiicola Philippines TaxID=1448308 RepID=A0A2T2N2H4_CORCC|nr:hypothetical protein BS50DRAFT_227775 [Corynespora cassiicola Philippines]